MQSAGRPSRGDGDVRTWCNRSARSRVRRLVRRCSAALPFLPIVALLLSNACSPNTRTSATPRTASSSSSHLEAVLGFALMRLYEVTENDEWVKHVRRVADFMLAELADDEGPASEDVTSSPRAPCGMHTSRRARAATVSDVHLLGNRVRDAFALEPFHDVEAEIDTGGDPPGGDDVSVDDDALAQRGCAVARE